MCRMESARIQRLLDTARQAEIQQAIQRQKNLCCGPTIIDTATIVPVESGLEQAKSDVTDWGIVFPKATVIYGTTVGLESARINALNQAVLDASTNPTSPDARFSIYRRPYVPPACPPISTEILNANLPKPSTKPLCIPERFQGTITPS